jgi:hypothetical protein
VKFIDTHAINSYFADLKAIKITKGKHQYGDKLLKAFMKKPFESYTGGGDLGIDEDEDEDEDDNFAKYIQRKRDPSKILNLFSII